MAHVKAGGVTKGNRDSKAKRLGIKRFGGQTVKVGEILVRQKGTKFRAGSGTKLAGDYSIYSLRDGVVNFIRKLSKKYITVT